MVVHPIVFLTTLHAVAANNSAAEDPTKGLEAEVQEIFEDACSMCHDSSDEWIDLESPPSNMLGKLASTGALMVIPGNASGSYLYQKMVGDASIKGDPMPLEDDPLPEAQLAKIRQWIDTLPTAAPSSSTSAASGQSDARSGTGAVVGSASGLKSTSLPERKKRARKPFLGTHQINLHTTTSLGKKTLEMRVHHRFGRVGKPGDRNYLGLASGATMSIGMGYGIVDGLDVLLRWTNIYRDWELGMKYLPVRQEAGMPVSFGGYASIEVLTDTSDKLENPIAGSAQVLLSRLWAERLSSQLTVNYSWATNHNKGVRIKMLDGVENQLVRDKRSTLNVGVASTVWVDKKRRWGVDVEYQLPIPVGGEPDLFYYHGGDADPNGSNIGSWALGGSVRAGLHLFQVFVTNTRSIHTNLVAPGGDTKNPFDPFGDFFFGFNLSRKWKL